jgi:hypothetical protein
LQHAFDKAGGNDPAIAASLDKEPTMPMPDVRWTLLRGLRDRIRAIRGEVPRMTATSGWAQYRFEPITITKPDPDAVPAVVRRDGDRVIVVWLAERPRDKSLCMWVTAMAPDGGHFTSLATTDLPLVVLQTQRLIWRIRREISDAEALDGTVYVGTSRNGLVICRDGVARIRDETSGLASKAIHAVTQCNGTLYLGVGSGGLYSYRPADDRFVELASSRAIVERNLLDRTTPYELHSILADTERDCLWLGIMQQRDDERRGVWRYDLKTGRVHMTPVPRYDGAGLGWYGRDIAVWASANNWVDLYFPETGEVKRFMGQARGAMFGNPGVTISPWTTEARWPFVFLRDHIVSLQSGWLALHTAQVVGQTSTVSLTEWPHGGKPPAFETALQLNDHEAILGTRQGEFWTLKRREHQEK